MRNCERPDGWGAATQRDQICPVTVSFPPRQLLLIFSISEMLLHHTIMLIFPLRSDIIGARPLQPASVTPVLARAEDNIYTQPSAPRTQVRHICHVLTLNMG